MQKVILITGASSGLGKTTADHLIKKGHIVFGTSRKATFPKNVDITNKSSSVIMIPLDITNQGSIADAIRFIQKRAGHIDVLINNAGWGVSGPVEETSIEQAKSLFETNFFGSLRVTQQIIPYMREHNSGLIINISSIGGVVGLPFQGLYSATKFAIEGITESLRMEVDQFGINVVLVEPGDFKTDFTKNRKKIISSSSAYTEAEKRTTEIFEHDEKNGTDPHTIAYLIEKIVAKKHPKLRYRVGSFSQKMIASLKGTLSDRIVQWILMRYYKIK